MIARCIIDGKEEVVYNVLDDVTIMSSPNYIYGICGDTGVRCKACADNGGGIFCQKRVCVMATSPRVIESILTVKRGDEVVEVLVDEIIEVKSGD